MGPFVNHQGTPLAERLAADVADQQLLATVQPQVVLKRTLGRHRFTRKGAVVLILAHVGLDVEHQRILVDERLAAELALVLHRLEVRVVHLEVLHQGMIIREGLIARVADVLLGAVLHVHVAVEPRRS